MKLSELKIGKYYYRKSTFSNGENFFERWVKVFEITSHSVKMHCIEVFTNEESRSYLANFEMHSKDYYKTKHSSDDSWQEITEEEFVNQIEELKCELNQLITNN